MRLFEKLFRKKKPTEQDEASDEVSQEAAVLAQIKKWEEDERLCAAVTTSPSLGEVGSPSALASEAGGATEEQRDGDNVPLEKQEDPTDNILVKIWEAEEDAGHGNSMVRDIVSEVEEVDAERLRDELISFSRELSPVALVVDDEANIRALMAQALASYGWRSVVAAGGEAALEHLRQRRFDIVFLDLLMPGMNGAQTFREVRKLDPTVRVLIITAHPDSALMEEALQVGPFAIMRKPFSLQELGAVLTNTQPPTPILHRKT